jgi:hypothetical protein
VARTVTVRAVQPGDVDYLLEHMREADRLEVTSAAGADLREVLETSIAWSPFCWAAELEGRLISIWGFVPESMLGDTAIPWMLGTDDISRIPGALTRIAKGHIAQVRETYPLLVNHVDVRNTASWRWLKRLGFTLREPAPFGLEGLPFYRFDMGFSDV